MSKPTDTVKILAKLCADNDDCLVILRNPSTGRSPMACSYSEALKVIERCPHLEIEEVEQ